MPAAAYRLFGLVWLLLLQMSRKVASSTFLFVQIMYNLRTRVRAVDPCRFCPRPQAGMGARVPPVAASQVTTSQALDMCENVKIVPESEVLVGSDNEMFDEDDNVTETVGVTQPPTLAQMIPFPPLSPVRDTPLDLQLVNSSWGDIRRVYREQMHEWMH